MNKNNAAGGHRLAFLATFVFILGAIPYLLWNRDVPLLAPLKGWMPAVPQPKHTAINDFIRYNFPDGAWFLSLLLMQRWLGSGTFFEWMALCVAICLEVCQHMGWLSGTFDPADVSLYIIIFISYKLCTRKQNEL